MLENADSWPELCILATFLTTYFFLIQFYIPFKIISAHMRWANLTVVGAKTGEP